MSNSDYKEKALEVLNRILETELSGVVGYTHYSFMVFGYNRIPIVKWLREQSKESLIHAEEAGEMITHLGGHPSLKIGPLLETENHDVGDILKESLLHETLSLELYNDLLNIVRGKSVFLEEYATRLIVEEELHVGEVDKMLRKSGDINTYR